MYKGVNSLVKSCTFYDMGHILAGFVQVPSRAFIKELKIYGLPVKDITDPIGVCSTLPPEMIEQESEQEVYKQLIYSSIANLYQTKCLITGGLIAGCDCKELSAGFETYPEGSIPYQLGLYLLKKNIKLNDIGVITELYDNEISYCADVKLRLLTPAP